MIVVWFSRHDILPSQIAELKRKFGEDVEIIKDPNPFSSADEVIRRFREAGADEMLIVAPLSVVGKICEAGIKPLWAEMEQVPPTEAEVTAAGRHYRFKGFKRVKRLALEFEDL